MEQSISFITFAVKDFNGVLGFYQRTLGWKPFTVVPDTVAFFNVGSLVFSLCAYKELANDVGLKLHIGDYAGITTALNLPTTQAVDDIFVKLETSKDAQIIKKPLKTSWGGYSGYFADPENHLWEVAYNPQFKYDNHGTMIVPTDEI